MRYDILLLRSAQKELANLPKQEYPRVRDALKALCEEPRHQGVKNWKVERDGVFE